MTVECNKSVHIIKVFTVLRFSFEQVSQNPHSSLNPMLLVANLANTK